MEQPKKPTAKQPDTEPATTQPTATEHQKTVEELNREKQRRRSRPVLVVILTLLLIGVGAFLAWYAIDNDLFGGQTDDSTTNTDDQQQDIAQVHDAAWAIEALRESFDGESSDIERPLLAVQTSGNQFKTDAFDEAAYTGMSGRVPADEVNVTVAEMGKVLTDDDFTEDVSQSTSETSYSARYYGADAACVIDAQGSADNPAAAHALQVACIDTATLNELAETQAPLYAAASGETNIANAALLGEPNIEQSSVDGYQRATQAIGPANLPGGMGTMYFYQAPEGDWTYISTVGDTGPAGVQCDELNDQAKQAYRGEVCYNDLEEARVE